MTPAQTFLEWLKLQATTCSATKPAISTYLEVIDYVERHPDMWAIPNPEYDKATPISLMTHEGTHKPS